MNCSMNTGTVDQHTCGICGESSTSLMEFFKHKIKHVDRGSGIGCEICQISFSRQGPLLDHYRRKHHINLTEKSNDSSSVNNYLRSKKKTSRTTLIDQRKDANISDGHRNSGVYNNVKITKLTVSPKGELIVKQVENVQSNGSGILEKVYEYEVKGITDKSSYNVEIVNNLPSVSEVINNEGATVSLPSHDYGTEDTIQYDMAPVNDCKDDNNCDNDDDDNDDNNGGVIFTSQSLETWHEQTVTDSNEDQNSVNVNTEPVKIDFVIQCNPVTSSISVNHPDTNNVSTTVLEDIDRSTSDDQHQHVHPVEVNHDSNISTTILEDIGGATSDNHHIPHLAVNQDNVSNFIGTSIASDINMIANIDGMRHDTLVHTRDNQGLIRHKTKLPTRIKRPKLTQVPGKIPQELNMSDFYFIKLTSQSGANVERCTGKDIFQCLYCKKSIKWRSDICRHMRQFHEEELDSGIALKSPDGLQGVIGTVMKMTDYIELENTLKPKKRKRGIETQDLPGDFECEECGKVFHKLRNLRFHRRVHETGNEFLCSICSKLLKTKAIFERHLKTHQEKQTYKCNQCDFESTVNIAIHRHRQIHNTNSHLCDICGLAYKDKSTLTKHKKVHDLSRPFACTHPGCAWRFMTEVMCNAHIRSHSSKRKYKCTMCGYAFYQKHHLQRHEKIVHNIIHKTKSDYESYNWKIDSNSESELNNDIKDANSLEVSHEVNLIINDGNIPGVMSSEHFDLETALQSGQLVIANDDGTSVNYEMTDLGSNIVYQTLLHDGVGQHYETQTVCITPHDSGDVSFHEVNSVQTEVEIEQS